MARSDRVRWEKRYTDVNPALYKRVPRVLEDYVSPAEPGMRALELACGLGYSAMWLAERGYTVDAIDISLTALTSARATMRARGLCGVNFIAADLDNFPLPVYAYDLVIVFRFLDRDLFPAIRERVRPGGRVIYRTFNRRFLEKRPDATQSQLLRVGEMRDWFPGWNVLHYAESGESSTFVGRKPQR